MSLLKQDITKKGQVNNSNITALLKLDKGDNQEYMFDAICESEIYAKEWDSSHLLGLYYLVLWKSYPKKENTWEPASTI